MWPNLQIPLLTWLWIERHGSATLPSHCMPWLGLVSLTRQTVTTRLSVFTTCDITNCRLYSVHGFHLRTSQGQEPRRFTQDHASSQHLFHRLLFLTYSSMTHRYTIHGTYRTSLLSYLVWYNALGNIGDKEFPEEELTHLEGHQGSRPVRYYLQSSACVPWMWIWIVWQNRERRYRSYPASENFSYYVIDAFFDIWRYRIFMENCGSFCEMNLRVDTSGLVLTVDL